MVKDLHFLFVQIYIEIRSAVKNGSHQLFHLLIFTIHHAAIIYFVNS